MDRGNISFFDRLRGPLAYQQNRFPELGQRFKSGLSILMFKGREVLPNSLSRLFEPSIRIFFRRYRSTKSAIHAALQQPRNQYEGRGTGPFWVPREKVAFVQETARNYESSKEVSPGGNWGKKGGRQKISNSSREQGGSSISQSWNRSSGYERPEHENDGEDMFSESKVPNSPRRSQDNSKDYESRFPERRKDSGGRPGKRHSKRSKPKYLQEGETLNLHGDELSIRRNMRTVDRYTSRRSNEMDLRETQNLSGMQGLRQQNPGPVTLPYTTSASEFLYGKSVVTAALRARRREFYKLYMFQPPERQKQGQNDREMRVMAIEADVPVEKVGVEKYRMLDKISGGRPHNGFILEASPLPKLPIRGFDRVNQPEQQFCALLDHQSREDEEINGTDPWIKYSSSFPRFPFVLLLDGVVDPQNLGAIIRSAFFFGVDAIALTTNRTAPLSPAALKASAGASEAIPILTVDQTRPFLDECKKNGWKIYASQTDRTTYSKTRNHGQRHFTTSTLVSDIDKQPCILIIGSEGRGLYKDVEGAANVTISIEGPRQGELGIDSLNVSVATGLLCEKFLRKPSSEYKGPRYVSEPEIEDTALRIQERLF